MSLAMNRYFDNNRNVETKSAITALSALAQEARLAIFRLLVQVGASGLPAGKIAEALAVPPSSLSFHLKELSHAGLVRSRQESRFIIYSANFEAMNDLIAYLTENCCGGRPCMPTAGVVCPMSGETAHEPEDL